MIFAVSLSFFLPKLTISSFVCFYLLTFLMYFFSNSLCTRKRKMSGFGHRVYKNYDPRAKVIKKLAEEVFSIVGRDPLIEVYIICHIFLGKSIDNITNIIHCFQVAVALEKAALSDEYFVKRKLYPNVDFYSGLIYRYNI